MLDSLLADAVQGEADSEPAALGRCVRVQKYGLLPPIEGRDRAESELVAAARYYNALIALERCQRDVFRALRKEHVPEIDALEAEVLTRREALSALRAEIKDHKQSAGAKSTAVQVLSARATNERDQLFAVKAKLKEARLLAREHAPFREAARALEERRKVWHKALRRTIAPSWGTYLQVEQSFEQARRAVVDPAFRAARGRERVSRTGEGVGAGALSVQLQGGLSAADLYAGQGTQLRLVDAPPSYRRRRTSARGMRRCATKLLYLRVGSDAARGPLWAVFPCVHHRPIPLGAVIKACTVRLSVLGMQERWTASITYQQEPVPMPERAGIVALDLGWRKRPDGSLRVAYWADDAGAHEEVVMPARVRDRLRRQDSLRSIQQRHFARVLRGLCRWLPRARHLPAWLPAQTERVDRWRSHARLRRLAVHWRAHRFPGDWVIFPILLRWLHRSRHLSQWEEHARENALRARRECYRIVACKLARAYGAVVLENFNLSEQKRLSPPEGKADAPRPQRVQLHHAAPGEFRSAVTQAVLREGGLVVKIDATGTTTDCHACGAGCTWDQEQYLRHTCEHCGMAWDQDENAAKNLLRMFVLAKKDESAAAPVPRARAARFAKRHKPRTAE